MKEQSSRLKDEIKVKLSYLKSCFYYLGEKHAALLQKVALLKILSEAIVKLYWHLFQHFAAITSSWKES